MEWEAIAEALIVVEEETVFQVSWESDADDWVVRFEKSADFPAYEWAARMAQLYNARSEAPIRAEP